MKIYKKYSLLGALLISAFSTQSWGMPQHQNIAENQLLPQADLNAFHTFLQNNIGNNHGLQQIHTGAPMNVRNIIANTSPFATFILYHGKINNQGNQQDWGTGQGGRHGKHIYRGAQNLPHINENNNGSFFYFNGVYPGDEVFSDYLELQLNVNVQNNVVCGRRENNQNNQQEQYTCVVRRKNYGALQATARRAANNPVANPTQNVCFIFSTDLQLEQHSLRVVLNNAERRLRTIYPGNPSNQIPQNVAEINNTCHQ